MAKICIIIDNNVNNVNGVVTTFRETTNVLIGKGYDVKWITPSDFVSVPCPTYPEVRLALNIWKIGRLIENYDPDFIHIATEGPLGYAAMMFCEKKGYKFTTSYHTKTPEYIKERFKWFPLEWGYAALRRLHKNSANVLITTESMKQELIEHGFKNNIVVWGRGVNTTIFNDSYRRAEYKKKLLYVGRVSTEKNIEEFLDLPIDLPKIIVGDGPQRISYERKYADKKNISFVGYKSGVELATHYANAAVFVFPSYTDTYGIVMLEAMACGTPIAAHDVTGPKDCIEDGQTGALGENLMDCVNRAMMLDRSIVKQAGQSNTWDKCTMTFLDNLVGKL